MEFVLYTPTAVPVGSSVPFGGRGNGCIKHRDGSGVFTLKGGRWSIYFRGNVTGVDGNIRLALFESGEELVETRMNVTPAATTDAWSVSCATEIPCFCDCTRISVQVVAGDTVTVNNAEIIFKKEA